MVREDRRLGLLKGQQSPDFHDVKPSLTEWRRVVSAVETSLPIYDSVSEKISLNKAERARELGVEYLELAMNGWVIDVGVGPGASTRMLLEKGFGSIVGLDPSITLLRHASSVFPKESFHPVLAVSEYLPFRRGSVDAVLTCFALRDVLDPDASLNESSRVVKKLGRFVVVDVGKPGNLLARFFVSLYIRLGMPIISSILSWRRVKGNPFRMIVPTYDRLVSNNVLEESTRRVFGNSKLQSIMFGGLIVLTAERT